MKMLRLASQGVDFTLSRPKEKWAFAHSFLRVTPQCAEGEAKGQIRLLSKNTPISGEFQRGESHPSMEPDAAYLTTFLPANVGVQGPNSKVCFTLRL
jgi:hypothetical protein